MRLSGYRDKANRAPNIQPWHEAERLGSATTSTAMRGYSRRGNEAPVTGKDDPEVTSPVQRSNRQSAMCENIW